MMAQYMTVKDAHPGCLIFYRMGDFYELFFDDAIEAAAILDITLTKRGRTQGDDIAMCGVPYHAHEAYLARLIRAGKKVAICEQTESPAEAKKRGGHKALVNREVVRIVTAGTLTEDTLLEARANQYIVCIHSARGCAGLAWLDISTGAFYTQGVKDIDLSGAVTRLEAREILLSDAAETESFAHMIERVNPLPAILFKTDTARGRLHTLYEVQSLDSFGAFSEAEVTAAGVLVDYILRTQAGVKPYLAPPKRVTPGSLLEIDAATRLNLELTRTANGDKKGSLLHAIDQTVTAAGGRLLQARLAAPLSDREEIEARLDKVDFFVVRSAFREEVRKRLKDCPDLERAIGRLSLSRGGPRDLGIIRDGLAQCAELKVRFEGEADPGNVLADLNVKLRCVTEMTALADMLNAALKDDLPALLKEGGFVRSGYHAELDRQKQLRDDSRKLMAGLQARYQKETGVETLKISYNNVLGYFIEVSSKKADPLLNSAREAANDTVTAFIHRQTMANAMRFTTKELTELEGQVAQAGDNVVRLELEIYADLVKAILAQSALLNTLAAALAEADVTAGLAALAEARNYCRPEMTDTPVLEIDAGRHPVIEQTLPAGERFTPNDCALGEDDKIWLLSGPNMAGKSTFLRQNALIAVLAHMGGYVPANAATIGIMDRIFSRVGASDDLARGRSTFMVEMIETAAILNQAGEKSFVILDEIGRGTATYDGLSIAWAAIEHLHDVNSCRTLFSTHYHELTALEERLHALSCHAMQVKDWQDGIVFLHKVGPGAADRSYGIHVAQLAGLPKAVIKRAETLLKTLEKDKATGFAEDLPLFSAQAAVEHVPSEVEQALAAVDPDSLSPRKALDLIYKLRAFSGS